VLHNDSDLFKQVILRNSEGTVINASVVEKDYYVTLFLKAIVEKFPDIVFKGGTSLSKCYKLIDRFSEDIDLSIDTESSPTEGQRKNLKKCNVSIIDSFGFKLINADNVRSRRSYNKYIVDYPSVFGAEYLKENLIIETSVYIRAYPFNKMTATCFIYDYLHNAGFDDFISDYGLEPFELTVQTAERSLIDKLFALGDYYLSDMVTEHSRHIYDIYKLLDVVALNDELKELAASVVTERKNHSACLSAQDGIDISILLREIIDKNVYKEDYENITSVLLFEPVEYDTAIEALEKVLKAEFLVIRIFANFSKKQ